MKNIILASKSPRRIALLRKIGLKFKVEASRYSENLNLKLNPRLLARVLSAGKAEDVAARHKNAIIIAADTVVVSGKKILGQPRSKTEAKKMLKMLSGRSHKVITGFTIMDTATGRKISGAEETKVFFRKLSGEEIESYVNSGEPMGKAGAYAVQGLGAVIVRRIEGDYFNVVGLPLNSLTEALKKFGVSVLQV
ncbi:MAG: Maf family protein [bacterium]